MTGEKQLVVPLEYLAAHLAHALLDLFVLRVGEFDADAAQPAAVIGAHGAVLVLALGEEAAVCGAEVVVTPLASASVEEAGATAGDHQVHLAAEDVRADIRRLDDHALPL